MGLHWCRRGFSKCKRLLGDLGSLGPKDLLHPFVTTFGNFLLWIPSPRRLGLQYQNGCHCDIVSEIGSRKNQHTATKLLQSGKGHVKKRQKSSKSVKTIFDTLRAGKTTTKIVNKCQQTMTNFDCFRQFFA